MAGLKDIEVKKKTIDELFRSDFYEVPEYQREYVWSDTDVMSYFGDIFEAFESTVSRDGRNLNTTGIQPYYLGNIVLAKDSEGNKNRIEIIDGQQRLTTSILLVKALSKHCEQLQGVLKSSDPILREFHSRLTALLSEFDMSTERNERRIKFLYTENQVFADKILYNESALPDKQSWSKSQQNLVNGFETLEIEIESKFPVDSANAEAFRSFLKYVLQQVIFSVVYTGDVNTALLIFQNLNNRGVGLEPSDLVKNLLIIHSKSGQIDSITNEWKRLTSNIESGDKTVRNVKVSMGRFLRHYCMARYDKRGLRGEEVFSYIQNSVKELGIDSNPVAFAKDLADRAERYVLYLRGYDQDREPNEALSNIAFMKNVYHMIPLMFAENLPRESFKDFTQRLENLLFAYSLSGKNAKYFEDLFCSWSKLIQNIQDEFGYQTFIDAHYVPELLDQRDAFYVKFAHLSQKDQASYRQKYILSKLGQVFEVAAHGRTESSCNTIRNKWKEIEHILPQTPTDEYRKRFMTSLKEGETYEEFVRRFGNLTLLDKSLNILASNHFYEEKIKNYTHNTQSFILTRMICEKQERGNNSQFNKLITDLEIKPFDNWTRDSIVKRQDLLLRIAGRVWGFDEASSRAKKSERVA